MTHEQGMTYFVAIKVYARGPEATCLGVFRNKDDAIEAIESDDEYWDPEFRVEDEDWWASTEASATIEEHEID